MDILRLDDTTDQMSSHKLVGARRGHYLPILTVQASVGVVGNDRHCFARRLKRYFFAAPRITELQADQFGL